MRANIVELLSLLYYRWVHVPLYSFNPLGYIWYEPIIILGLLFPNTPPWTNTAINSCLIKTPKNLVEKYEERVHSAARCIALVASLKTIIRNFWKTHLWEKEYNGCLQDIS